VLYPDEVHDGRAGSDEGFGYRIVYVEPFLLTDAVRTLRGRPYPRPFVSEPVSTNAMLSRAIDAAFRAPLESLALDSLIVDLAQGLMTGERGGARSVISRRVDVRAIERARQFLDAEKTRVVHSLELESVTGLTRYDLCRQFRITFGTSPYRYLLMRRLGFARERIHQERPLVEVAFDAGFADQAHFTRPALSGTQCSGHRSSRRAGAGVLSTKISHAECHEPRALSLVDLSARHQSFFHVTSAARRVRLDAHRFRFSCPAWASFRMARSSGSGAKVPSSLRHQRASPDTHVLGLGAR